jgi:DNA-binding SARP family transcriptional activator
MDRSSQVRDLRSAACEHISTVHLLNGPYVSTHGERREVPEGSKRLLAFVAIQKGRLERRYVAGSLWPFGDDNRAAGNLRSALWRLRGAGVDVIDADKWSLCLADTVDVDIDEISGWASRVLAGTPICGDFIGVEERIRALDILPGCYDDWAITERERIRQRILHALEQISRLLCEQRRFGEAVEAAMAAVHSEPLRESAQRALIESHLAEGNVVEARRVFCNYAQHVRRELGIEPSAELQSLLGLPRAIGSQHRPLKVPYTRNGVAPSLSVAVPRLLVGRPP